MRRAFCRMTLRAMTSLSFRDFRWLTLLVSLAAPLASARALVGGEPDGRFADRVAMVLIRGGDKAGFCTGLVLSPRIVLTAAHCLRPLRDMAVHYRDGKGAAVITVPTPFAPGSNRSTLRSSGRRGPSIHASPLRRSGTAGHPRSARR